MKETNENNDNTIQPNLDIDAKTTAALSDALVPYVPKSKAPFVIETLIPKNMEQQVAEALNRAYKQRNIDDAVRDALAYPSKEALWKGLAAEQVDAIGLYLAQFEKEQGIIIADQTGIGKGRQAAAVIRHAVKNGYLPIFFTKKPDLFSDMYRDLKAIDFGDIHPFIVNNGAQSAVRDGDGTIMYMPLSATDQYEKLQTFTKYPTESAAAIAYYNQTKQEYPNPNTTPYTTIAELKDYLPEGYDMIFCTYSQVQSANPYKRDWLEKLIKRGVESSKTYKKVVLILDESHMAGSFHSIIGTWMREVLPFTKAACFLSATFAKYPEVMPFYAKKTALSEINIKDDHKLVDMMRSGGLRLQEIVATGLSESGQLIRRQRSNKGVLVDYITLNAPKLAKKHRKQVDAIISIMVDIVEFEKQYVDNYLDHVHRETKAAAEQMKKKPKGLGIKQSPYTSRVFNTIDQMLFALKAKEVADFALKLLYQNKKVVIAFKSTMGTFLNELGLAKGDTLTKKQMSFTNTLIKGLDSILSYNYISITGQKSKVMIPVATLGEDAAAAYYAIKERIENEVSELSISPIDVLIHHIEKAEKPKHIGGGVHPYFKVGEVTGRKQRIVFEDDLGIVYPYKANAEESFREFNSGSLDVLLINQSGSTGFSAHASTDFKDQRTRAMIITQFELDINVEVQKRGRIHRTGQVKLPEYYYITSVIPLEKRLMTMLKAKLKSLDANTTASQKTNDSTLKSVDFLNKYGDIVAWQWVNENQHMMERMAYPTYHKVKDEDLGISVHVRNTSKDGAIRQLTGRAGLLTVKQQDELYDQLLEQYHNQIEIEKQQGTYDLETEFLKLDADVKKRFLYLNGNGTSSPFGRATIRDSVVINNLDRPLTKIEVDKLVVKNLKGLQPEVLQQQIILDADKALENITNILNEKQEVQLTKLQTKLEKLKVKADDSEKVQKRIVKLEGEISERRLHAKEKLEKVSEGFNKIKQFIGYWKTGQVVKLPFFGNASSKAAFGIFLGVKIGKAKNPFTPSNVRFIFAAADYRKVLTYSLNPLGLAYLSTVYTASVSITPEKTKEVQLSWNELIKEASAKRIKRSILTENIIAAADKIDFYNKLIRYNTTKGEIKNGILIENFKDDNFTLLPISNAYSTLKNMAKDMTFYDSIPNNIAFKAENENTVKVYIRKKANFKIHTDALLRGYLIPANGQSEDELPDFVQNANDMIGMVSTEKLELFLKRLDEFNITYKSKARVMEDWEIENQKEWKARTSEDTTIYSYALSKTYGDNSNPQSGFKGYDEPSDDYNFGTVRYNRMLSDKERYNYGLIPVFNSAEDSYRAWKKRIRNVGVVAELDKTIDSVTTMPLHVALEKLGQFILLNAASDGNPEFVFGSYTATELAKAWYQDMIAIISPIDIAISQLEIILEK